MIACLTPGYTKLLLIAQLQSLLSPSSQTTITNRKITGLLLTFVILRDSSVFGRDNWSTKGEKLKRECTQSCVMIHVHVPHHSICLSETRLFSEILMPLSQHLIPQYGRIFNMPNHKREITENTMRPAHLAAVMCAAGNYIQNLVQRDWFQNWRTLMVITYMYVANIMNVNSQKANSWCKKLWWPCHKERWKIAHNPQDAE